MVLSLNENGNAVAAPTATAFDGVPDEFGAISFRVYAL